MTKLRFVDLAGSEKIPKIFTNHEHYYNYNRDSISVDKDEKISNSNRLSELIGINKSLTALGHCINSLSKEQA